MNEVTEGIYGRPGGPGAEKLAGGAKTVGGAIPFPSFMTAPWRIFGKTFGGSGGQGWPTGRIGVFTCKTFVGTFALKSTGHTCSCIFPFGVRGHGWSDGRKRQKIPRVGCCLEGMALSWPHLGLHLEISRLEISPRKVS